MIDLSLYRKYVERIDTTLRACPFKTDVLRHTFASGAGLISLQVEVAFHDNSRFRLSESFVVPSSTANPKTATKKITYQYMKNDGKLIFRIDCHGISVPLETQLHLDLPFKRHIEDGDPILNGTMISDADFHTVYGWICRRLANEPLPWEDTNAKA